MNPIPKPILYAAPALMPVGLEALKTFLRVDGSSEDALITTILKAATQRLEKETRRKFVTQTWDIFFDSFGCSQNPDVWWDGVQEGAESMLMKASRFLDLPFGPLVSVSSVSTFDDDNTEYTFDSIEYMADLASPRGRIGLKLGAVWPATILRAANGIKVRAVFGFGAGYNPTGPVESAVPEDIQQAIMLTCSKLYENRGDSSEGENSFSLPTTALAILEPYMEYRV